MDTISRYATALAAADRDGLLAALAGDVRLYPPTSEKVFRGRDTVSGVLCAVTDVLRGFVVTEVVSSADGRTHGVVFDARVGEMSLQGWDLLELDADGRVAVITVMMRPLPALSAFAGLMSRRLNR
jgi:hypothetical protein